MIYYRNFLLVINCLAFLILQNQTQAQNLKQITPSPVGLHISVDYVSDQVAYAINTNGFLSKTIDGGKNWQQTSTNFSGLVSTFDIDFVNESIGVMIGNNGKISKTTDGGVTWKEITSGTTEDLIDIFFLDSQTGFIAGRGGTLLKSTDGGNSWTSLTSGTSKNIRSIHFADALNGYAAGVETALKTTDGGSTWTSMFSNATGLLFEQVQFLTSQKGYLINGGVLWITNNGGTNWTASSINGSVQTHKFIFTDENTVYAIKTLSIDVYKSTDGGASWTKLTTPFTQNITAQQHHNLHFLDNNKGYLVGNTGLILQTTDGGTTWVQRNTTLLKTW